MTREKISTLNPGEAMRLRAGIGGLSEIAARSLLYGLLQVLSLKSSISRKAFEEILDDAVKYSKELKQP